MAVTMPHPLGKGECSQNEYDFLTNSYSNIQKIFSENKLLFRNFQWGSLIPQISLQQMSVTINEGGFGFLNPSHLRYKVLNLRYYKTHGKLTCCFQFNITLYLVSILSPLIGAWTIILLKGPDVKKLCTMDHGHQTMLYQKLCESDSKFFQLTSV